MKYGTAYRIRNIKNNKSYIGVSVNLQSRKRQHFLELKKGIHHNLKLQRSFNIHGPSSFVFEIIEENIPAEIIYQREIELISFYNTYELGYNMTRGGDGAGIGNENWKLNVGKPSFHNRVRIFLYNYKTGEIHFFEKMEDCLILGLTSSGAVSDCAKGKNRRVKDWFVFYEQDFNLENLQKRFLILYSRRSNFGIKRPKEVGEKISKSRKGIKFSEEHLKNMSLCRIGKKTRKIKRNDGKIYNSIKEAALDINCDRTSISHNLKREVKFVKGYIFEYLVE